MKYASGQAGKMAARKTRQEGRKGGKKGSKEGRKEGRKEGKTDRKAEENKKGVEKWRRGRKELNSNVLIQKEEKSLTPGEVS
jgi:hypothetical protein